METRCTECSNPLSKSEPIHMVDNLPFCDWCYQDISDEMSETFDEAEDEHGLTIPTPG